MAVQAGRLLDMVISHRKARIYICIAWLYSVLVALFRFMDHIGYTESSITLSQQSGYGRVVWAFSTITLITIIMMIQISTYIKIRKRISMAVGGINAMQGLNNLYKRAMKKSTLVALCFAVGWAPVCIMVLVHFEDWTNEEFRIVEQRPGPVLLVMSLVQGFCNALIFRAKYLLFHMRRPLKCRDRSQVQVMIINPRRAHIPC